MRRERTADQPDGPHLPRDYIQTGISTIDGVNTLFADKNCRLFSGAGMPHDQLAAQIVRQATLGKVAGASQTKGNNSRSCSQRWASRTTWQITSVVRLPKVEP